MAHSSEVSDYVANIVAHKGDDPIQIPLQDNGTISLAVLKSQFGQVTGLYFLISTNCKRAVNLDISGNYFLPPKPSNKWGNTLYICVLNETITGNSNI